MIIAIDFDQTYTRDRDTWDKVIDILKENGAIVYCVTLRPEWDVGSKENGIERIAKKVHDVFMTNGLGKKEYMHAKGYHVDIWIDDMPQTIR